MRKLFIIAILAIVSCTAGPGMATSKENMAPALTVKRNGYLFSAADFNQEGAKNNQDERSFEITFDLEKSFLESHPGLGKELQYGIDSAFFAVTGKDTLFPLYVLPIANGQPLRPQYIVAFEAQPLAKNAQIELQTHIAELYQQGMLGLYMKMSK